ncbi:MAG: hypothetical protein K2N09_00245 [Muribaculaceae bacterium]|nr:hypothetical protein [Muribaculaceae bacterium]
MKKTLILSLCASLFASVQAEELKILSTTGEFPTIEEPQFQGLGLSADGKYVCGSILMGAGIFTADLSTDRIQWMAFDDEEGGELRHVDNNGVAVGLEYTYLFDNGELLVNEIPDGYSSVIYEDLTNDGSIIVGSVTDPAVGGTVAVYFDRDKKYNLLPIPPEEELHGLAKRIGGISSAKFISGDGKVILGFLGSFFIPIIWRMNDAGEYEYDFFVSDILMMPDEDQAASNKILYGLSAQYMNMSNNGRYICMLGMIYNENMEERLVSVVYDTITRDVKVYSEVQEIDFSESGLYPISISDNGTFIGCVGMPYFGSTGSFIMKAGETQAELFVDAFPEYYELLGESDNLGMSVPTSISADGSKILGYSFYAENYYDEETPAIYLTYVINVGEEGAVNEIPSSAVSSEAIYSIDGRRLSSVQKGLNIVRNLDGSVSKILKK